MARTAAGGMERAMIEGRTLAAGAGAAVVAALALAAALVTGAAGQVGGVAATSGSATFSDPSGDANGAADIVAVVISDDPASGIVQFTLTANGQMAIDPALGPEVNIFVDTDRNPATGSPSGREFTGSPPGAEYRLSYERTLTESGGGAEYWTGTSWKEAAPAAMSLSLSGDTFTWRLGKSDLGVGGGFDFYVGDEIFVNHATVGLDRAPESGVWSYELSSATTTTTTTRTAVRPLVGVPTTTPRKPVAGKRFAVAFPVTRSDSGAPLTSGRMICDPSVQGTVIPHAEQFKGGVARLSLTIPKSAKGKLLKVKVTIRLGSQSTSRAATFRVG